MPEGKARGFMLPLCWALFLDKTMLCAYKELNKYGWNE